MFSFRSDDHGPKEGDLRFEDTIVTKKGDSTKIVKRTRTLQYYNGYYWNDVPSVGRTYEENKYCEL